MVITTGQAILNELAGGKVMLTRELASRLDTPIDNIRSTARRLLERGYITRNEGCYQITEKGQDFIAFGRTCVAGSQKGDFATRSRFSLRTRAWNLIRMKTASWSVDDLLMTLADGTVLTVTDVHEQAGVIWHMVTSLPAGAVPGAEAAQAIDWAWRFDKMQQHTGEHILSGILHSMFGAENVGFHIGSDAVRMDTNIPISAEGLKAAETAANRIIWENVPVNITYPTREELAALTYRSKKEIEGQVRIVTIPGADVCACCGTHTAFTGAVGQIKILAAENYKGGVRLSIVCGGRALEAAQAMRARQAEIGALLSAKASETANAVHRVYDEYTALKFTHFGLCSQLFEALAALATPGADAIRIVPGLDPDGLHRLASRLTEATTGLCAALTPNEKGTGYCIAQAGGDVRALTKALNAALNGRGGGKPGICQGSCTAEPEQVEEFLRKQDR